jgi:hypothetical protein
MFYCNLMKKIFRLKIFKQIKKVELNDWINWCKVPVLSEYLYSVRQDLILIVRDFSQIDQSSLQKQYDFINFCSEFKVCVLYPDCELRPMHKFVISHCSEKFRWLLEGGGQQWGYTYSRLYKYPGVNKENCRCVLADLIANNQLRIYLADVQLPSICIIRSLDKL